MQLVKTLLFNEAFPLSTSAVTSVAVDTKARLVCVEIRAQIESSLGIDVVNQVAATVEAKIAIWTTNPSDESVWRIHSTLLLDNTVQCMDLHASEYIPYDWFYEKLPGREGAHEKSESTPLDTLCVGTSVGLSVYSLDTSGDLLGWKLLWSIRYPRFLPITPTMSRK